MKTLSIKILDAAAVPLGPDRRPRRARAGRGSAFRRPREPQILLISLC